jgi:hypothetical protein
MVIEAVFQTGIDDHSTPPAIKLNHDFPDRVRNISRGSNMTHPKLKVQDVSC